MKAYREKNRDKANAYAKLYREERLDKEKAREYRRDYYQKNKEKAIAYSKEYQKKEESKSYRKTYQKTNKEAIASYQKEYRANNKEKRRIYMASMPTEQKESRLKSIRKWKTKKKETDPVFKLSCNIGVNIRACFKKNGFTKSNKTEQILGCSLAEFKTHIESLWEPWMSWENYGKYNGKVNFGWDLDHIIPISAAETELEVECLNYYTNFQPLCSHTNRYIKRDSF